MPTLRAMVAAAFGRVRTESKPLPEPEPLRPQSRAMTGFLATLTDAQREEALAYCGDDHHGNPAAAH